MANFAYVSAAIKGANAAKNLAMAIKKAKEDVLSDNKDISSKTDKNEQARAKKKAESEQRSANAATAIAQNNFNISAIQAAVSAVQTGFTVIGAAVQIAAKASEKKGGEDKNKNKDDEKKTNAKTGVSDPTTKKGGNVKETDNAGKSDKKEAAEAQKQTKADQKANGEKVEGGKKGEGAKDKGGSEGSPQVARIETSTSSSSNGQDIAALIAKIMQAMGGKEVSGGNIGKLGGSLGKLGDELAKTAVGQMVVGVAKLAVAATLGAALGAVAGAVGGLAKAAQSAVASGNRSLEKALTGDTKTMDMADKIGKATDLDRTIAGAVKDGKIDDKDKAAIKAQVEKSIDPSISGAQRAALAEQATNEIVNQIQAEIDNGGVTVKGANGEVNKEQTEKNAKAVLKEAGIDPESAIGQKILAQAKQGDGSISAKGLEDASKAVFKEQAAAVLKELTGADVSDPANGAQAAQDVEKFLNQAGAAGANVDNLKNLLAVATGKETTKTGGAINAIKERFGGSESALNMGGINSDLASIKMHLSQSTSGGIAQGHTSSDGWVKTGDDIALAGAGAAIAGKLRGADGNSDAAKALGTLNDAQGGMREAALEVKEDGKFDSEKKGSFTANAVRDSSNMASLELAQGINAAGIINKTLDSAVTTDQASKMAEAIGSATKGLETAKGGVAAAFESKNPEAAAAIKSGNSTELASKLGISEDQAKTIIAASKGELDLTESSNVVKLNQALQAGGLNSTEAGKVSSAIGGAQQKLNDAKQAATQQLATAGVTGDAATQVVEKLVEEAKDPNTNKALKDDTTSKIGSFQGPEGKTGAEGLAAALNGAKDDKARMDILKGAGITGDAAQAIMKSVKEGKFSADNITKAVGDISITAGNVKSAVNLARGDGKAANLADKLNGATSGEDKAKILKNAGIDPESDAGKKILAAAANGNVTGADLLRVAGGAVAGADVAGSTVFKSGRESVKANDQASGFLGVLGDSFASSFKQAFGATEGGGGLGGYLQASLRDITSAAQRIGVTFSSGPRNIGQVGNTIDLAKQNLGDGLGGNIAKKLEEHLNKTGGKITDAKLNEILASEGLTVAAIGQDAFDKIKGAASSAASKGVASATNRDGDVGRISVGKGGISDTIKANTSISQSTKDGATTLGLTIGQNPSGSTGPNFGSVTVGKNGFTTATGGASADRLAGQINQIRAQTIADNVNGQLRGGSFSHFSANNLNAGDIKFDKQGNVTGVEINGEFIGADAYKQRSGVDLGGIGQAAGREVASTFAKGGKENALGASVQATLANIQQSGGNTTGLTVTYSKDGKSANITSKDGNSITIGETNKGGFGITGSVARGTSTGDGGGEIGNHFIKSLGGDPSRFKDFASQSDKIKQLIGDTLGFRQGVAGLDLQFGGASGTEVQGGKITLQNGRTVSFSGDLNKGNFSINKEGTTLDDGDITKLTQALRGEAVKNNIAKGLNESGARKADGSKFTADDIKVDFTNKGLFSKGFDDVGSASASLGEGAGSLNFSFRADANGQLNINMSGSEGAQNGLANAELKRLGFDTNQLKREISNNIADQIVSELGSNPTEAQAKSVLEKYGLNADNLKDANGGLMLDKNTISNAVRNGLNLETAASTSAGTKSLNVSIGNKKLGDITLSHRGEGVIGASLRLQSEAAVGDIKQISLTKTGRVDGQDPASALSQSIENDIYLNIQKASGDTNRASTGSENGILATAAAKREAVQFILSQLNEGKSQDQQKKVNLDNASEVDEFLKQHQFQVNFATDSKNQSTLQYSFLDAKGRAQVGQVSASKGDDGSISIKSKNQDAVDASYILGEIETQGISSDEATRTRQIAGLEKGVEALKASNPALAAKLEAVAKALKEHNPQAYDAALSGEDTPDSVLQDVTQKKTALDNALKGITSTDVFKAGHAAKETKLTGPDAAKFREQAALSAGYNQSNDKSLDEFFKKTAFASSDIHAAGKGGSGAEVANAALQNAVKTAAKKLGIEIDGEINTDGISFTRDSNGQITVDGNVSFTSKGKDGSKSQVSMNVNLQDNVDGRGGRRLEIGGVSITGANGAQGSLQNKFGRDITSGAIRGTMKETVSANFGAETDTARSSRESKETAKAVLGGFAHVLGSAIPALAALKKAMEALAAAALALQEAKEKEAAAADYARQMGVVNTGESGGGEGAGKGEGAEKGEGANKNEVIAAVVQKLLADAAASNGNNPNTPVNEEKLNPLIKLAQDILDPFSKNLDVFSLLNNPNSEAAKLLNPQLMDIYKLIENFTDKDESKNFLDLDQVATI